MEGGGYIPPCKSVWQSLWLWNPATWGEELGPEMKINPVARESLFQLSETMSLSHGEGRLSQQLHNEPEVEPGSECRPLAI